MTTLQVTVCYVLISGQQNLRGAGLGGLRSGLHVDLQTELEIFGVPNLLLKFRGLNYSKQEQDGPGFPVPMLNMENYPDQ